MSETAAPIPQLLTFWSRLTPTHQVLVADLIQSLAAIDTDLAESDADAATPQQTRPSELAGEAPVASIHQADVSPDVASQLLRQWIAEDAHGDPEEQAASWRELCAALDADRLSNRPLFP